MCTVKPHWQAVRKVIQYVFSFQGTPLRGGFLPTDKRCFLDIQGVFCLCRFCFLDCSYNISHNIQYVNRQLQNPRFWLAYVVLLLEKEGQRGVFYKKFSVKNSLFLVVTFCSSPLTNRPIKPLRTAPTPLKNPAQSHSTSSDPQISFCPSFYAQQLTPLFVAIHKLSPHSLSHSTKNSHSKNFVTLHKTQKIPCNIQKCLTNPVKKPIIRVLKHIRKG